MIEHEAAPQATQQGPLLRPEARIVRADRSLAAMVLLVCTLGGMGIGFGSAMYLMRVSWGTTYPPAVAAHVQETSTITWLGVGVRSYTSREGTHILRVFDGTAAERAGLRPGDVIETFDGERVPSAEALVSAVRARAPGTIVEIHVTRGGQPVTLHARLGRR